MSGLTVLFVALAVVLTVPVYALTVQAQRFLLWKRESGEPERDGNDMSTSS